MSPAGIEPATFQFYFFIYFWIRMVSAVSGPDTPVWITIRDRLFLFSNTSSPAMRSSIRDPEHSIIFHKTGRSKREYSFFPLYSLTHSMVQSPSWEGKWFAASQEIPQFYGTRRFITALTSVRHLSLSWPSPIQSTYPHPTSWRSILILPTHSRLGLPSGLFPSGFPTRTLYAPLSSYYDREFKLPSSYTLSLHHFTFILGSQITLFRRKVRVSFFAIRKGYQSSPFLLLPR